MKEGAIKLIQRKKPVSIKQISQYLENTGMKFEICGNKEEEIIGFSPFDNYQEHTITWIKNLNRYQKFKEEEKELFPTFIIIDEEVEKVSNYPNRLVCDNPKYTFALILKEFFEEKVSAGIGEGSIISNNVLLHENVSIGCNCVIEDDVIIGSGTRIYHNVVIRKGTVIGENCVIQSGTVIGDEGFGYSNNGEDVIHVPHFGHVVLADGVEIGSNCTIDRGTMDNTVVGKGSKIDNLCHIGHNVQIGKNVTVTAGVVFSGSVHVKDGVYIAPGAVFKNQIVIGEECIIGLGSVVLNDTQSKKVLVGVPAKNLRNVKENEDL